MRGAAAPIVSATLQNKSAMLTRNGTKLGQLFATVSVLDRAQHQNSIRGHLDIVRVSIRVQKFSA